MRDLQPWPTTKRIEFSIDPACKCIHCREGIPWRLVKAILLVGFVILVAIN